MVRILATALLCLTASGAFATSMGYLVKTDGLYYEMFTDVPFTGEVDEGVYRGAVKNGNREGPWVMYYGEGRVWSKGGYKNGNRDGYWVMYYPSGQLATKGAYKNGEREGHWAWFREDGTRNEESSVTYRKGKEDSD
jgi:antitoxin component YwqK of YwqJK toxin-antitoxin module